MYIQQALLIAYKIAVNTNPKKHVGIEYMAK